MLRVRWEASTPVPGGEAGPIPFDGELEAGWLIGLDMQEGEADSGRFRSETCGTKDQLARMLAVALNHAKERGFLVQALGYAELVSPGMVEIILKGTAGE